MTFDRTEVIRGMVAARSQLRSPKLSKKEGKMRKLLLALAMVGVLALLLSIPAQALAAEAYKFHVTVQGEKQGKIEGSCVLKGREGTIEGVRFQYTVNIPRDPQSGLPSGKRIHQPVVITKNLDKSSPKLFKACITGEHMKKVEIKFYRIDRAGMEQHYYSIKLDDAIVVSVRQYANALNLNDPLATNRGPELEDISFTFKKIKFTWEIDGIEAEDSWEVPI